MLRCLKDKVAEGIVIVNITQCQQGAVSTTYATGKELEVIGVVQGHDMTSEAAFAKLCYVLKLPSLSIEEKREVRHYKDNC